MKQHAQTPLEHEVEKAEILAGFRNALDLHYRQICQAARVDWERLVGADPADACVTVRVHTKPANATRGSGFLKSRKPSKLSANGSVPRFAH